MTPVELPKTGSLFPLFSHSGFTSAMRLIECHGDTEYKLATPLYPYGYEEPKIHDHAGSPLQKSHKHGAMELKSDLRKRNGDCKGASVTETEPKQLKELFMADQKRNNQPNQQSINSKDPNRTNKNQPSGQNPNRNTPSNTKSKKSYEQDDE